MSENLDWWTRLSERLAEVGPDLWRTTWETIYMVSASTTFSVLFGFLLAVVMILCHPQGIRPRLRPYRALDLVVNLGRSFPFIILLIAIIPFTRMVIGTTVGSSAMVMPLTIGAIPFVARIIEGCFLEVDKGVIEAARSFGASDMQIVWKVMVPEALPAIVLNMAVVAITLLGYSAMAGTVGGGGVGDLAVNYGYRRFQKDVMVYCVVILLIMVQSIQTICGFVYKRLR